MLQPLSPSIIITQPESWYLFAVPRRVEGWGVMWSAQRCCSRVSAAAVSRRWWCVWNVTRGSRTNYRPATPANAVHRHRPSAKVPGARSQPTIQPMVSIVQLTIRSALRAFTLVDFVGRHNRTDSVADTRNISGLSAARRRHNFSLQQCRWQCPPTFFLCQRQPTKCRRYFLSQTLSYSEA